MLSEEAELESTAEILRSIRKTSDALDRKTNQETRKKNSKNRRR